MCNIVCIEFIVGMFVMVGKIFVDIDYCKVVIDKVLLEVDCFCCDVGIDDGNGECDFNDFYFDI